MKTTLWKQAQEALVERDAAIIHAARLREQNASLLHFAAIVARSACLKQFIGDKCRCFSCLAKELL